MLLFGTHVLRDRLSRFPRYCFYSFLHRHTTFRRRTRFRSRRRMSKPKEEKAPWDTKPADQDATADRRFMQSNTPS